MGDKVSFADFKRLNLVVARIVEARPHPNADKLLCMKVDLGGQERQIVAGIKGHYRPEELAGLKVILVENLEPATLRGERSEGMLLAATSSEGRVVLLAPGQDVPAGSKVS